VNAEILHTTKIMPAHLGAALNEALHWLRRGEIVAFPTDTVYGVGAPMDNDAAVQHLCQVKARPYTMGIPLLLGESRDIGRVCRDIPPDAWKLVERFWPGGLTLVLSRQPMVSDWVTGGRLTVAVRLPNHSLPRKLVHHLGVPLAATSANRSGEPPPVRAEGVVQQLGGQIPLVLDGGFARSAYPSTIVDLSVKPPALLRSGSIPTSAIEDVLGQGLVRQDGD
jgi:L-threonylcarbamoyladenylate synthase